MAKLSSVMLITTFCLAGVAAVSGQRCGEGTVLDKTTNTCVVMMKAKRDLSEPRIVSDDGSMLFTVDQDQKVGVRIGDEDQPTQYLETSNSTVGAVVAAMKLGYEMNREMSQVKDMQQLRDDLQQQIADARVEGVNQQLNQTKAMQQMKEDLLQEITNTKVDAAKERETFKTQMTASLDTANKALQEKIDASDSKLDAGLSNALQLVKTESNKTNQNLELFQKKTTQSLSTSTAAVDNLKNSVPTAFCNDKVKNNGETDVDCGGPCNPCAKGKKCQYSSDCDASVCVSGTCKTCSQGSGVVSVSPGHRAFCQNGELIPSTSQKSILFDSCGKTGENPPTETDCKFRKSLKPDMHSLTSEVTYNFGTQRFVAPIDGAYTWTLYGAAGGTDGTCCSSFGASWSRHGKGGEGARVTVTQNGVKAGTVFYINVGQKGYDCFDTNDGMIDAGNQKYQHCIYNPSGQGGWDNGKPWYDPDARHVGFNACGGFNGGGPAICNHNMGGASGGGATDIRMCKNGGDCETLPGLDDRFVVAGGGGGGSCEGNNPHSCNGNSRWGGHGGTTTGENGYSNGWSGYGGSQTAGGRGQSGGNRDHGNSYGTKGQGGTGGRNDGGGGGGGYFGGGGAHHNAGGGGGSSFVGGTQASGRLTVVANARGGNRNRDGYVLLRIKG